MHRRVLVLCALVVVTSFAVGTGSYSAASAERGVTVDVVDDENAYMSLVYPENTVRLEPNNTHRTTVVTVRNQFRQTVEFTITVAVVASNGLTVRSDKAEKTSPSVGTGESFDVPATVTCRSPGRHRAAVSFHVTATGTGITAETATSRTVEYRVDCSRMED